MAKRGRKSQAELVSAPVRLLGARPQPPLCLNARAQAEWRRVVDAMPSDWFRPQTLVLLQSYCSLVAEVEWHELMIEKVRKTAMTNAQSWKRYQELVKLHDTCIGGSRYGKLFGSRTAAFTLRYSSRYTTAKIKGLSFGHRITSMTKGITPKPLWKS